MYVNRLKLPKTKIPDLYITGKVQSHWALQYHVAACGGAHAAQHCSTMYSVYVQTLVTHTQLHSGVFRGGGTS